MKQSLTIRATAFQVLRPSTCCAGRGDQTWEEGCVSYFPFTWENQRPACRDRAVSGVSWGTGIDVSALPCVKQIAGGSPAPCSVVTSREGVGAAGSEVQRRRDVCILNG